MLNCDIQIMRLPKSIIKPENYFFTGSGVGLFVCLLSPNYNATYPKWKNLHKLQVTTGFSGS